MFFCDPCAETNRWPTSMFRSAGHCEVCGKTGECSDVPSKYLPEPSDAATWIAAKAEKEN